HAESPHQCPCSRTGWVCAAIKRNLTLGRDKYGVIIYTSRVINRPVTHSHEITAHFKYTGQVDILCCAAYTGNWQIPRIHRIPLDKPYTIFKVVYMNGVRSIKSGDFRCVAVFSPSRGLVVKLHLVFAVDKHKSISPGCAEIDILKSGVR